MLLKAALIQHKIDIFNKEGRSYGFEKCVNLSMMHCHVTDSEAGVMRTIDSFRDAEQHWLLHLEEDVLYLHVRGLITAFDEILKKVFKEDLSSHLPIRVLPISTKPPSDFNFLVDREYKKIYELLKPGRRARDEARGRIRTLLALESHTVDEVAVSEKDISRIEKAIKAGKEASNVFPRLSTLGLEIIGEGIHIQVHFSKKKGAPVRFISGNDPEEAAAIRETDLQRKFYMSATELAKKLNLTQPKSAVLRKHLNIDNNPNYTHIFEFGKTKHARYSDNAFQKMRDEIYENDIEIIWRNRK